MNTSRILSRSSRAFRQVKPVHNVRQHRFQSSTSAAGPSSSSSSNAAGTSHTTTALLGGVAGGAATFLLAYIWYSTSGVKTAVSTAKQAKSYLDAGKEKLKQAAPEPNEALEWLRKQTYFYASFVPGGKSYVDTAFKDLDTVRQKHGGEVDQIVKEAYEELKNVSSKDLSVSTATEAWQVLQKHIKRVGDLASDSAKEILDNHPQLKSTIGSNVDQLRSLGDSLGPEANKLVTDTWSQMRNIVATGGIGAASIAKIKQLIEQKTEEVKRLGDKAWTKGAEELKPYLDKNPKLKELLETNKKDLVSGNVAELWNKAKEASQSGNAQALEDYVRSSVDKAQQKASGLMGGSGDLSSLSSKFNEWKDSIENTDTKGLENLVKQTVYELEELLQKKLEQGKAILENGRK